MSNPAAYVQPIHFEDFDGTQFERLVFAYHARAGKWKSLEWYGQAGSDLGRDIWGVRDNETTDGESVCIQCINRKNLIFTKAEKDISKVLKSDHGTPHRFRIVTRSIVSAEMRAQAHFGLAALYRKAGNAAKAQHEMQEYQKLQRKLPETQNPPK
jgi:hypothetical protein